MRILHTADTHIGYRQYGSEERRDDFLRAFETVVNDAIEDDFSALIHAGDLFHQRNPRLEDIIPTIDLFTKLENAGVPALAVVGNHESKRDAQWLDLLENLGLVTRLGRSPYVIENVAIYGVDYVPRSQVPDFEYEFESSDADYNLLVLHGRFKPFPYGEWELKEFVERSDVDWDAFLLGDFHDQVVEKVKGVWATYSGSTERTSTNEEKSPGYNIIEIEEGIDISFKSIENKTRDLVTVDVELTSDENNPTKRVIEKTREYDVEDKVVIIRVDGESKEKVVQSEIENSVAERGALVARVTDRREIESETKEIDVSFADPERAVEERINSMGLSEAAQSLDFLVRDSEVADTNVADEAESRIEDLLESGVKKLRRKEEKGEETADDKTPSTAEDEIGKDERDECKDAESTEEVDEPETRTDEEDESKRRGKRKRKHPNRHRVVWRTGFEV
ncbi:MAG: DNA repair exonuclease [Halobacteria archaeon]|nr:DNA repair exonuclease [Halobacteria archaeon]